MFYFILELNIAKAVPVPPDVISIKLRLKTSSMMLLSPCLQPPIFPELFFLDDTSLHAKLPGTHRKGYIAVGS